MIQINYFYQNENNAIVLDDVTINKASRAAIEAIKKELPEEAHTVEVMELIIEEIEKNIKESKILL